MAPKKTRRNGTRRNRNRSAPRPRNNTVSTAIVVADPAKLHDAAELVCAVTDPFCERAKGAKWFSTGSIASTVYQQRILIALTTDANGHALAVFAPSVNRYVGYYGPGSTWTLGTDPFDIYNSAYSDALTAGGIIKARVVSAGARFWDISAATAAGGSIVIQTLTDFKAVTESSPIATFSTVTGAEVSLTDRRKAGLWVSRANDVDSYELYEPSLVSMTTGGANTRTAMVLGVSGEPSSIVLQMEWVINIELSYNLNSLMSAMSTRIPRPFAQTTTKQAAEIVENSMPSTFFGTVTAFGNHILAMSKSALKSITREAAYGATTAIMGPARYGRGAIMDVD